MHRPQNRSALKPRRAMLVAALCLAAATVQAQELTPHPENWRPIVYRDLQMPGPQDRLYADLWADVIQSNNRRYLATGDRRFLLGNAPVREAHALVRGGDKVALLSILDTATHCISVARDLTSDLSVKMCPMRLAVWNGSSTMVREAKGCYLEPGARAPNTTAKSPYAASYMSYNVATKSFRLGVILGRRVVEQCSQTVPLYPE
jgi:hypothetical protein